MRLKWKHPNLWRIEEPDGSVWPGGYPTKVIITARTRLENVGEQGWLLIDEPSDVRIEGETAYITPKG